MSGVGPYSANRETLIVPVTELLMFKSFFVEYLDQFQSKFAALVVDLNAEIKELASPTSSQASSDRNSSYYRSSRKISRSSPYYKSYGSITHLNAVNELDSVEVDSISIPHKPTEPQVDLASNYIIRNGIEIDVS